MSVCIMSCNQFHRQRIACRLHQRHHTLKLPPAGTLRANPTTLLLTLWPCFSFTVCNFTESLERACTTVVADDDGCTAGGSSHVPGGSEWQCGVSHTAGASILCLLLSVFLQWLMYQAAEG
jgi:sterol desaturase/sphingolipid hydroxylase (fatty acid hydroxylase superfamily)